MNIKISWHNLSKNANNWKISLDWQKRVQIEIECKWPNFKDKLDK